MTEKREELKAYTYVCENCGHVMRGKTFGKGKCGNCRSARVKLQKADTGERAFEKLTEW